MYSSGPRPKELRVENSFSLKEELFNFPAGHRPVLPLSHTKCVIKRICALHNIIESLIDDSPFLFY